MPEVVIVGSRQPCVELPTGERRRVRYDDHVQRLIDRGYVEVEEWHDDPEPEKPKHAPRKSAAEERSARNPQTVEKLENARMRLPVPPLTAGDVAFGTVSGVVEVTAEDVEKAHAESASLADSFTADIEPG